MQCNRFVLNTRNNKVFLTVLFWSWINWLKHIFKYVFILFMLCNYYFIVTSIEYIVWTFSFLLIFGDKHNYLKLFGDLCSVSYNLTKKLQWLFLLKTVLFTKEFNGNRPNRQAKHFSIRSTNLIYYLGFWWCK